MRVECDRVGPRDAAELLSSRGRVSWKNPPYAASTWTHMRRSCAIWTRSTSGSTVPVFVVPALPITQNGRNPSRRSSSTIMCNASTSIRRSASHGTTRTLRVGKPASIAAFDDGVVRLLRCVERAVEEVLSRSALRAVTIAEKFASDPPDVRMPRVSGGNSKRSRHPPQHRRLDLRERRRGLPQVHEPVHRERDVRRDRRCVQSAAGDVAEEPRAPGLDPLRRRLERSTRAPCRTTRRTRAPPRGNVRQARRRPRRREPEPSGALRRTRRALRARPSPSRASRPTTARAGRARSSHAQPRPPPAAGPRPPARSP